MVQASNKITNFQLLIIVFFTIALSGCIGISGKGNGKDVNQARLPQYISDTEVIEKNKKLHEQQAEKFEALVEKEDHWSPEVSFLSGDVGSVEDIAVSPDGRYVAACYRYDNFVRLWEIESGRVVRTYSGHSQDVWSVAFSADGSRILTGSDDGTAILWDTLSSRALNRYDIRGRVNEAVFSPDGKYIAAGSSSGYVSVWDIASGEKIQEYRRQKHSVQISSLAFSPDGNYVVSGAGDSWDNVRMHEIMNGNEVKTYETHARSLAFSPDGKYILTGAKGGAHLLDAVSGEIVAEIMIGPKGSSATISSAVDFSSDGRYFIVGFMDGIAELRDSESGNKLKTYDLHMRHGRGDILAVAFTPDDRYVLAGCDDGKIRIWETTSGQEVKSLAYRGDGLFGKSGRRIHTLSAGNFATYIPGIGISLLDMDIFRIGKQFEEYIETEEDYRIYKKEIRVFTSSTDGNYLLSGEYGHKHSVKLWDTATGKELNSYEGHSDYVGALAISKDNRYVLTGSYDTTAKLWETVTGREVRTFRGHIGNVGDVAFSSEGEFVYTAGPSRGLIKADHTIRKWDISTGEEIKKNQLRMPYFRSSCFTPDGESILIVFGADSIELWNIETGNRLWLLDIKEEYENVSYDWMLKISSDQKYGLGAAEGDFRVNVIDMENGELLHRLKMPADIRELAFSADGKYFHTLLRNGTIQFRDTISGKLIYTTLPIEDGRFLRWTPDGYFTGDKDLAYETVYVVKDMKTISIGQFFDRLYRPDILDARVAGLNVPSTDTESMIKTILAPLPKVSIEAERNDGSFRGILVSASPMETKNMDSYHIRNGSLHVRISAEDLGGGVENLRLFHNGSRVPTPDTSSFVPPGKDPERFLSQEFSISLVDGVNTLKAVAFTDSGIESTPAVLSFSYEAPKILRPHLWLFALGINHYENSRYNLNYAADDARGFIANFEKMAGEIFDTVHPFVLIDADANLSRILEVFNNISKDARPEDVFVFFYAGHGIALQGEDAGSLNFYFIPPGVTQMTSVEQLSEKALSGPEFEDLVSSVSAQKQLYIIDACNAGAVNAAFGVRGAAEEIALSRLSRAAGSALIAASRDDQFAQEFRALGQGALTKAVIDGLKGGAMDVDGNITVGALKSYVEAVLPELTKKYTGRAQFPTGFIFGQDFPIGVK